jgi:hypothetical protein
LVLAEVKSASETSCLAVEFLGLLVVLLGLRQAGLAQHAGGLGGGERGLLLLQLGLVEVGLDADEEVALLHGLALDDGDLDEFTGDLGGDLDLDLGLDLAGRRDEVGDGLHDGLLGGHGDAALLVLRGGKDDEGDDDHRRHPEEDEQLAVGFLFLGRRRGGRIRGCRHGGSVGRLD